MIAVIRDLTDSPLKLGTVVASVAALGYIVVKGIYPGNKRNKNCVLPPGPPQDLLIGNLRQFPKDRFWDTFCEWAKRYGACPCIWVTTAGFFLIRFGLGPVVYVKLPGISMVILNSYEVAQDVLSKRPNTTAGREIGYMVKELYVFINFMRLKC
jgi:hypothetical protein